MRSPFAALVFCALAMYPSAALAHPAPFTYLDVRLLPGAVEVTLVAHMFDLAHDLELESQERLLDAEFLRGRQEAIARLVAGRVLLGGSVETLKSGRWSNVVALAERQSVQLQGQFDVDPAGGSIEIRARLFPYDPAHQTFVNFYESDALTLQAILDFWRTDIEYFPGSRQGVFAVLRRFVPQGFRHIAAGLDHWLFLVGLLLVGGSRRRYALILAALVVGHAAAGTMTAFNLLRPLPRIIEPAVALSIIYVGADNLMVRGGRDMRVWIALAFGVVHGFWFAGALGQMDLPRPALLWSLFSFDLGAEAAHAVLISLMAAFVLVARRRGAAIADRLAIGGSLAVIAGGIYLFVTRVFFPAGMM